MNDIREIMESYFGFRLPKGIEEEFSERIQAMTECHGALTPQQILEVFRKDYTEHKDPYHFRKCQITDIEEEGNFATVAVITYTYHGEEKQLEGVGNGPIDAVQRGLEEELGIRIKVLEYSQHALSPGSGAQVASYIYVMDQDSGKKVYGVGISSSLTRAAVRGLFSAVNRLLD